MKNDKCRCLYTTPIPQISVVISCMFSKSNKGYTNRWNRPKGSQSLSWTFWVKITVNFEIKMSSLLLSFHSVIKPSLAPNSLRRAPMWPGRPHVLCIYYTTPTGRQYGHFGGPKIFSTCRRRSSSKKSWWHEWPYFSGNLPTMVEKVKKRRWKWL